MMTIDVRLPDGTAVVREYEKETSVLKIAEEMQKDLFRRSGIDYASIGTHEDYVKPLINLFAKR